MTQRMQSTIENRKPKIETPRLSIVPFAETHLTPRYVGWLNDPEVVRYSEQRHHAHTLESCRAYRQSFADTPHCFWAIVSHDPNIGHIGNINAYIDMQNGVADVGILIGEKTVWGQGYGSEAWQAVCRHLLHERGLRKITAGTLCVNHGMQNIMRRAGMTEDANANKQLPFEGKLVDVVQMSLSRSAPLRIALLGCGSIGRRHLANVCEETAGRGADIVVYDAYAAASQGVVEAYKIRAVGCPEAVWEQQPNVVLICTPSHLHTPFALAAANVGAALFIEKPVAHNLQCLEELNALVTERNLVNLVGCNMRFHPGPAQIKNWLEASVIGDVLSARLHTGSYLPAWRPQQDYRNSYSASPEHGGALLDCIHELDLACWLLGPATLHNALVRPASSLGLQTDGLAELLLSHESGAISSVHLNFVQRNYQRSIEIIGTEGTLAWDFNSGEAVRYDGSGSLCETVAQPANWQLNQMYRDELAYFLRCVETVTPTFNPVCSATETLKIALQAHNARTNEEGSNFRVH